MAHQKMVNINELPAHVADAIRSYQYDNPSHTQGDILPDHVALTQYLHWEGVLGYVPSIMSIFNVAK